MDLALERDCTSALGSLFQQIINDLKNTSPLWEDFVTKATKLHQCLRAAIQAIAAYLDAFQKIADAATNSRGASKEIGTALTRVCLRHKAVESRLKTFTTAIMDCLVQPLQEKLEDWKRTVITIDKEHAKEYKRCRTELKKRSSDTLRLQKKARKGQSDTIQTLMDSHKQDVTLRRAELEEVEKKSLRSAMIEERLRYCTFVHMLQPVVKEECEVMSELGHLQEAMDSIAIVTKDPSVLPQTSEELIQDTKATMTLYPESPGGGSGSQGGCSNSLGSRKSSVCSISSMNSSGSSNSPGHHHYPRSLSQLISPAIRLKPGESSDSGFCSSPALTTQASTATSQSHAVSTWPPHSQDAVPVLPPAADRPHTISTAYEKGHQRPPLTVYTFQNPETILEGNGGSGSIPGTPNGTGSGANTPCTQKSPAGALNRPPLPVRCSSLERPLSANNNRSTNNLLQRQCPSPIPAHITKELSAHHAQQQHIQQQQQQQQQQQHQFNNQQQQPHLHSLGSSSATTTTSGNNNNLVRSSSSNSGNTAGISGGGLLATQTANKNATAATNLLAANATASKILKLATNAAAQAAAAAAAANNVGPVDIIAQQQQQQHKLQAIVDKVQLKQQQVTPTKIALPNLVNLGILTPATSPTKQSIQTLTFTQQQQQQQHSPPPTVSMASQQLTPPCSAASLQQSQLQLNIATSTSAANSNNNSNNNNGNNSPYPTMNQLQSISNQLQQLNAHTTQTQQDALSKDLYQVNQELLNRLQALNLGAGSNTNALSLGGTPLGNAQQTPSPRNSFFFVNPMSCSPANNNNAASNFNFLSSPATLSGQLTPSPMSTLTRNSYTHSPQLQHALQQQLPQDAADTLQQLSSIDQNLNNLIDEQLMKPLGGPMVSSASNGNIATSSPSGTRESSRSSSTLDSAASPSSPRIRSNGGGNNNNNSNNSGNSNNNNEARFNTVMLKVTDEAGNVTNQRKLSATPSFIQRSTSEKVPNRSQIMSQVQRTAWARHTTK
uniref:Metastasis suppressor protein 1 n=1 Tax=Ceratitis capitata TaxID=7213 RepID=W8AJ12_CERCA